MSDAKPLKLTAGTTLTQGHVVEIARALDAAQAEVTALRARVAELEAKVERQKASLSEHMKKTPIQTALEVAVPALEAERDESAALAERLREALTALCEYERKRHPPRMGGDHFPPSLRDIMQQAHDALSTPAPAWLRERDRALAMRVAEAAYTQGHADGRERPNPAVCAAIVAEVVP